MDLGSAFEFDWREVDDAEVEGPPGDRTSKRGGLTATLVGSKVYTIGGTVTANYVHKLYILDLVSNTWSEFLLPPSTERRDHVAFLWNDYLYVYSGWRRRIVTDLFRVDLLSQGSVEPLQCVWDGIAELNFDYFSGSLCEPRRELVMFGGKLNGRLSNRTFCMRVDTHSFYEPVVKGQIPTERHKHTSCCLQDMLFVYGGRSSVTHYLCDLNVLNMRNSQYVWSQVSTAFVGRSAEPRLLATGGRLFLLGGERGPGKGNFNVYSLRERKWLDIRFGQSISNTQPTSNTESTIWLNKRLDPTHAYDVVASQTKMFLVGGMGPNRWNYWTIYPRTT